MFIGWLTCIPAVLLPHSLCRFTTANAPANRQMPIASVVMCNPEKGKFPLSYEANDQKAIAENQRLIWSLGAIREIKNSLSYEANVQTIRIFL